MTSTIKSSTAAALVVALLAAGCGAGGEQGRSAADVVAAYRQAGEAFNWGRWDVLCDHYSGRSRELMERLGGGSCADYLKTLAGDVGEREFDLVGVAVHGDEATGRDPATDEQVRLVFEDGAWRIDDMGG